jgi:hypothetical protein
MTEDYPPRMWHKRTLAEVETVELLEPRDLPDTSCRVPAFLFKL